MQFLPRKREMTALWLKQAMSEATFLGIILTFLICIPHWHEFGCDSCHEQLSIYVLCYSVKCHGHCWHQHLDYLVRGTNAKSITWLRPPTKHEFRGDLHAMRPRRAWQVCIFNFCPVISGELCAGSKDWRRSVVFIHWRHCLRVTKGSPLEVARGVERMPTMPKAYRGIDFHGLRTGITIEWPSEFWNVNHQDPPESTSTIFRQLIIEWYGWQGPLVLQSII
jgi:hypothetical protein